MLLAISFLSSLLQLNTFVCQAEENIVKFVFYPIGLVISCVFLAITLIVYLSLPKVCYILALAHTHTINLSWSKLPGNGIKFHAVLLSRPINFNKFPSTFPAAESPWENISMLCAVAANRIRNTGHHSVQFKQQAKLLL